MDKGGVPAFPVVPVEIVFDLFFIGLENSFIARHP
jgi:hypothetical protein